MNPLVLLAIAGTGLQMMSVFKQAEMAKAQADLTEAQLEIQRQAEEYERELKAQELQRRQRQEISRRALAMAAQGADTSSSFFGQLTAAVSEYQRGILELQTFGDISSDYYSTQEALIDLRRPGATDTFLTVLGTTIQGGTQAYILSDMLGTPQSPNLSFDSNEFKLNEPKLEFPFTPEEFTLNTPEFKFNIGD